MAPGELTADVEGDIEDVEGILAVTKIRVKYHFAVPQDKRPEAERALELHKRACPASNSVERGIQVSWDADIRVK
ncbi:MAG: OsmC family protein [Acidobacteria bacterium]|nr:OsmC family protein [Acidobacteriota bacterium]MCI0720576.1 OsmC family protein [Acidobacteriota bacterium]